MLRIVVLTSRESFIWYSMQEVIPYIEACWEGMSSEDYEVVTFNIDSLSVAELTPKLIGADRVVITCFNYRMCKVVQYIREILRLNINFLIHVHNLSTIAFWPYRYFASSEVFLRSDIFITSCYNDKKVLQKVFQNPEIHVIPYFAKNVLPSAKETLQTPQNIVYFGRISAQKNLHNLILGYSILKHKFGDQVPPLILFGKEDHVGSPNMNIRSETYLEFLQSLCSKLKISGSVFFKGHVDRQLIDDFLNDKANLFVSPSLHSEESFGVAAMQSILARNRALLSDWGVHSDFKAHFPNQVDLIPVSESDFGPSISADNIANAMWKCLSIPEAKISFETDPYYSSTYYLTEQKKAVSVEYNASPLHYTPLADQVYETKMDYTTSSTQIFSNFQDPLFHQIAKFYIGDTEAPDFPADHYNYSAVPWMTYADEIFMIDDPQKGPLLIQNDLEDIKNYKVQISESLSVSISTRICEKLFKCGYINRLS